MAAIRADGAKGTAIPFPQKKFCDPEYGEPPDWPNENPEGSLYVPCMSTPPTAAERQASRPADKKSALLAFSSTPTASGQKATRGEEQRDWPAKQQIS
ncbi:hypothetical protein, variant [Blastomyces dermatitidis ATCC 26199]|nr:hypothetical protein BDFG_05323 [Blastomyces dermatitidis ATCC 26199]EQL32445.1 hypothetical protein, variant [Blastomyces dermatitidis ATCC 26199]